MRMVEWGGCFVEAQESITESRPTGKRGWFMSSVACPHCGRSVSAIQVHDGKCPLCLTAFSASLPGEIRTGSERTAVSISVRDVDVRLPSGITPQEVRAWTKACNALQLMAVSVGLVLIGLFIAMLLFSVGDFRFRLSSDNAAQSILCLTWLIGVGLFTVSLFMCRAVPRIGWAQEYVSVAAVCQIILLVLGIGWAAQTIDEPTFTRAPLQGSPRATASTTTFLLTGGLVIGVNILQTVCVLRFFHSLARYFNNDGLALHANGYLAVNLSLIAALLINALGGFLPFNTLEALLVFLWYSLGVATVTTTWLLALVWWTRRTILHELQGISAPSSDVART